MPQLCRLQIGGALAERERLLFPYIRNPISYAILLYTHTERVYSPLCKQKGMGGVYIMC